MKVTLNIQSAVAKEDLRNRLRRIEGQSRGVQKMLADDRDCREILQQLKAMQAAVRNATLLFMRSYARECLTQSNDITYQEVVVDEIMDLVSKIG